MRIIISFLICLSFINSAQAAEVSFEKDARLPLVYVNVAFRGGTVTDPKDQEGITNFMGEMLLRGTKARNKQQIDLALDQMGARLDVETRAEALIFRGAVLSSQLKPFLTLLTEILSEPSFPEAEIKKLKSETVSVLQEELGHDPTLATRKFSEFLFHGHPYGKSILGKTKDIESLTAKQIQNQFNRLIREETLIIVGTGDSSPEVFDQWAKDWAKAISSRASQKIDAIKTVEKPTNGKTRRLLIVDKPNRTQTQILIGQIGVKMTDSSFFPLYLGNYSFGGPNFQTVLMQEIREKRGWSYGASSNFRHGLQPRLWQVHLFPKEKDTAPALELTLKLIDDLKSKGLTQEKFTFSQGSLIKNSGFMYNTPKKRVENTLLEKTLDLPNGFMKSYASEIQKLKLEDVNEALQNFIQSDKLAITVVGTSEHIRADLAKAAGLKTEEIEVRPYTEE